MTTKSLIQREATIVSYAQNIRAKKKGKNKNIVLCPKHPSPKNRKSFFFAHNTCEPKKIKIYAYSTLASLVTGTILPASPSILLSSTTIFIATALTNAASVATIFFSISSMSNKAKFKSGWCLTRYF